VPGDRVLTRKGLATVAAIDGAALWIQADVATRLGAGVLRYEGKVSVVRRVLAPRTVAGVAAGDIVKVGERRFLARDDGAVVLEEIGGKDEVIREAEIEAARPVLVQRPELPATVTLTSGKGTRALFSVSTIGFRGKRVMPGDVVEIAGKRYDVSGERAEAVWFTPHEEGTDFLTVQPQALLDPAIVRIVEFADGGIAYKGK
jgi:hypothetical protein